MNKSIKEINKIKNQTYLFENEKGKEKEENFFLNMFKTDIYYFSLHFLSKKKYFQTRVINYFQKFILWENICIMFLQKGN